MNLIEQSDKLAAELKAKALEFALDNNLDYQTIEAAMMIGAITASGYCAQIEQPKALFEPPYCCGQEMVVWDYVTVNGTNHTKFMCDKCRNTQII